MCFYVKAQATMQELQDRFEAEPLETEGYEPQDKVNGFAMPYLPVITQEDPDKIQLFRWGLIPHWASPEKAPELAKMTLNAKSETLYEKPSFKGSVQQRCLVLVSGFYEWRHQGATKIPYYIHLNDTPLFALGGLYSHWQNRQTGTQIPTFTIITTPANELMEYIHNTKKRMPFVLNPALEKDWIRPDLKRQEMTQFMHPLEQQLMVSEVIGA
ncbi:SOS response-associated peptidase [Siphonobacter sp.]|uniref:SOS response-associated peptidase n=1 Tax=Siphonobacter sp. TaxID=1869184 RepID=UPI003B3AEB1C